jgi:hypothetical protein
LGVAANERAVFNRMLEVLKDQPALKAVVIVALEGKQPDPDPEPDATPGTSSSSPEPAEPLVDEVDDHPPADLPKLVQKWREELVNTYKIHPDRLIVLFATARYSSGSYLQIWAMPPGQPLPQPDTGEAEEIPPKKP